MRKPLPVSVSPEELSAVDPRWREAVEKISELQSRDLTYWEEFPIELPHTAFEDAPPEDLAGIFQAPTDDELDAVARGPDGSLKRLSSEQLTMLKQEGHFSIASERYAGQRHVWVLSALLQRGRAFIRERQRKANAAAIRELRFRVVARISEDHPISVLHAAKKFSRGLFHSVDLFLGLPQRRSKYLGTGTERILQRERRNFVLQGFTQASPDFTFVRGELTLDLALQEQKLMEKAWPTIETLCAKTQLEFKQNSLARREVLLASLREQAVPQNELASRLSLALSQELRELLFQKIKENQFLASLYLNLPTLLVNHARASVFISAEEQAVEVELEKKRAQEHERLCREHPTLSLIPEWINRQVPLATIAFYQSAKEAMYIKIQNGLQEMGLTQEAFLFSRGLVFMKEREPEIMARLGAELVPAKTFTWPRYLWRSKNWKILQHETVYTHSNAPRFYVDKYERPQVKTDSLFWRPRNAFWRAASFLNNGLHWLLVKNAWSGPLGLRALFGRSQFSPSLQLDARRGTLVPSTQMVPTFRSRLRTIWRDIQKSRRTFEAKPDTGIIGKAFSRWINRAWNYIIKGFLGTLLVLVGQPILTFLNLSLVLLLTLTSVAWAPLGSIGVMALNIVLYDTESTSSTRVLPLLSRVFQMTVQGAGQAVLAVVLATLFHPLLAILFLLVGGLRSIIRLTYDDVVRWLILKRLGRVPATSGFLARRVAGPGLSSEFYFQVRPALVLLIAQANLERLELQIYEQKTQAQIDAPLIELQKFTAQVFGYFSRYLDPSERVSELLNQTTKHYTEALAKAVRERNYLLDKVSTLQEAGRIRQTRQDLVSTLARLKPMVQNFCETRLFLRLTPTEKDAFFVERGLSRGDFAGLARWVLSTSISPGLLEPLEDADRSLRLMVEPLNLNRYVSSIQEDVPIGDDLDRVRSAEAGLSMPYLAEEASIQSAELFGPISGGLRELIHLPLKMEDEFND
jgi:hypothetical protein